MLFKRTILAFSFLFFLIAHCFAQDENNPCLKAQAFHVVVIGSSTAAGTGPSVPDSTWVNRYRKHLQAINPSNQVTNLAIGGTNTYQIMPNWFVPPAGRPNTNPTNNISQAIALGADAVIVNMPSNDAASGYTANEQLFNFTTIVNSADSFGVLVYTCTTQPRVFSASQVQVQLDVRDSVLSAFGNFAIDFWNGLADTTGFPFPAFDSGDGVHLNDAGHNILFNRVKSKNILSQLFTAAPMPDFTVLDYEILSNSICGDSLTKVTVVVGNLGADSVITIPVSLVATNLDSGFTQTLTDTLFNGLTECSTDTFEFVVNTLDGGNFNFKASLVSLDMNPLNDSLEFEFNFSGYPGIEVFGDTICSGSAAVLTALASSGDTILWYSSDTGAVVLSGSSVFNTPILNANATYFAEAVRGDLFYSESIFTREQTNINFNGYMFDVHALTDVVLDSMDVKFNTAGAQVIELYTKSRSHVGYDTLPAAWNLWHTDSIMVDSAGQFVAVNLNGLNILANDTIAIYIQLQNASGNLSYQSLSNPITRTNNELSLITGSGISHNFNGSFYPRDLACEIYYHFGFRPTGDCSTGRVPVEAMVTMLNPDLGNDTMLCQQDPITLNPGNFFTYIWSNGATTQTLNVPTFNYPIGDNLFYVTVFDSAGCSARDSIIVHFLLCSGLNELQSNMVSVYPVPSEGLLYYNLQSGVKDFTSCKVFNLQGRMLEESELEKKELDLRRLPAGTYIVVFLNEEYFYQQKVTIVH